MDQLDKAAGTHVTKLTSVGLNMLKDRLSVSQRHTGDPSKWGDGFLTFWWLLSGLLSTCST